MATGCMRRASHRSSEDRQLRMGRILQRPAWPAVANVETNGETENARNVGQLGTCGSGYAVDKPRGKRCGERFWLRKSNAGTKTRMENLAGCGFSVLLTTTGNSEMRSQNPKNRSRPENGSLSPVRPVYHRPVSGVSPGAPNAKTRAVPPRIYRTVPLNHNWSASAQVFWRVRSLRYPQ